MPAAHRVQPPAGQTQLEQYSQYFNAVEINSSFYRPHRLATYERWRNSVPPAFRFAVKVPKLITHERRLVRCSHELAAFLQNVAGLAEKLAVLVVQLPPRLAFEEGVAQEFLRLLREETAVNIACEPRNPSWFSQEVDDLFERFAVTRIRAHPLPRHCPERAVEHGDLVYWRLHGAPHVYYSPYSVDFLQEIASQMARGRHDKYWCIFDNTAQGAAWPNARCLIRSISSPR